MSEKMNRRGQDGGSGDGSGGYRQTHSSAGGRAGQEPVALQVYKRGRWVVVGKVVPLDGQTVLAVAVRHQQGTSSTVSIPLLALDYAEAHGCRWFVWRHDRRFEMRRIRLSELRAEGWLQADGEMYIPLERMERVTWAEWPYAERVIRLAPVVEAMAEPDTLDTASEPEPVQMGLWG